MRGRSKPRDSSTDSNSPTHNAQTTRPGPDAPNDPGDSHSSHRSGTGHSNSPETEKESPQPVADRKL